MSTAKITSIDVLPLLAAALQKFRSEGGGAMEDLETELRRALDWIHHDRREYWTTELRRAQDALVQAKIQLQQATVMRRVADRDPSCIDEKRAVERARRRVENAQRKVEAVRHWAGVIDRAADDFRRARTQFSTWLDADLSRAVAALNEMSESLVTYISMQAPSAPPPPSGGVAMGDEPVVEQSSGLPDAAETATPQPREEPNP
jgi:hypothetical protein